MQMGGRNRIDSHWGAIKRLAPRTVPSAMRRRQLVWSRESHGLATGGGTGGSVHAPALDHAHRSGHVAAVLNAPHVAGGGGGGGGGGGAGAGPGLMEGTTQPKNSGFAFWHPPATSAAVLNQQLAPSNTPAAQLPRLAQSVQHSSLVVAGATWRDPLAYPHPAWKTHVAAAGADAGADAGAVTSARTLPAVLVER